jgi:hypothetical protein
MPGLRVRHDGWTEERTARFLDTLALTGCVRDAARVAGLSNNAGYRMRDRFPLFAAAWDDALARAQTGLLAIAYKRAVEGKETVIIRKGEEVERRISPSDGMLRMLVQRGDLNGARAAEERAREEALGAAAHAAMLSAEEHLAGWRFDEEGNKLEPGATTARDRITAKLQQMHERLKAAAIAGNYCMQCKQTLPPGRAAEIYAPYKEADED